MRSKLLIAIVALVGLAAQASFAAGGVEGGEGATVMEKAPEAISAETIKNAETVLSRNPNLKAQLNGSNVSIDVSTLAPQTVNLIVSYGHMQTYQIQKKAKGPVLAAVDAIIYQIEKKNVLKTWPAEAQQHLAVLADDLVNNSMALTNEDAVNKVIADYDAKVKADVIKAAEHRLGHKLNADELAGLTIPQIGSVQNLAKLCGPSAG